MLPLNGGALFSNCRAAAWRLHLKSSIHGRAPSTTSQPRARLGGGSEFRAAGRPRKPRPAPVRPPHRMHQSTERPRNKKETSLQSRSRPHRFGTSHQIPQSQIQIRFPLGHRTRGRSSVPSGLRLSSQSRQGKLAPALTRIASTLPASEVVASAQRIST